MFDLPCCANHALRSSTWFTKYNAQSEREVEALKDAMASFLGAASSMDRCLALDVSGTDRGQVIDVYKKAQVLAREFGTALSRAERAVIRKKKAVSDGIEAGGDLARRESLFQTMDLRSLYQHLRSSSRVTGDESVWDDVSSAVRNGGYLGGIEQRLTTISILRTSAEDFQTRLKAGAKLLRGEPGQLYKANLRGELGLGHAAILVELTRWVWSIQNLAHIAEEASRQLGIV